jgi:hypothetical protein
VTLPIEWLKHRLAMAGSTPNLDQTAPRLGRDAPTAPSHPPAPAVCPAALEGLSRAGDPTDLSLGRVGCRPYPFPTTRP